MRSHFRRRVQLQLNQSARHGTRTVIARPVVAAVITEEGSEDQGGTAVDDTFATLPGGARFAPGEAVLLGGRFMVSTIAFYLHTELVLTNRRLYAVRPSLLFGLIPVGTARANYPIDNIAGVSAGTRFDVLGVVFGAIAVLVGLGAIQIPGAAWLGWLLILLGLGVIIGAPKQAVEIMNSGGGVVRFPVSVFERSRTLEFANDVSSALAGTDRAKPTTSVGRRSEAAEVAAAMRDLQRLHDQGLITAAEYAAKRSEILARL